jgi:hypothetical protein
MPPRPIGLDGFLAAVRRVIAFLEDGGQVDVAHRLDDWLAPFRSPWSGGDQDDTIRELARELRSLADNSGLTPEVHAEVRYALRSNLPEVLSSSDIHTHCATPMRTILV